MLVLGKQLLDMLDYGPATINQGVNAGQAGLTLQLVQIIQSFCVRQRRGVDTNTNASHLRVGAPCHGNVLVDGVPDGGQGVMLPAGNVGPGCIVAQQQGIRL